MGKWDYFVYGIQNDKFDFIDDALKEGMKMVLKL